MAVLVTGCAGFIGSHLAEKLLGLGEEVVGIDAMIPYYPVQRKIENLTALKKFRSFEFHEGNIISVDLPKILNNITSIYHLAGQPGVRLSWGGNFNDYMEQNIHATQRLMEAVKNLPLKKFVYASSSSVYGNVNRDMLTETDVPTPYSPYGVTKLAGEHLINSYHANYGVPVTSLRFFTVFGPRQRPDMAFQRIIEAIIGGDKFTIYGDGTQNRDFTFVGDIVDGCIAASEHSVSGSIYNLGGTNYATLNDAIMIVQQIAGRKLTLEYLDNQNGDVKNTHANIQKAERELLYKPKVTLGDGLEKQFAFNASMGKV